MVINGQINQNSANKPINYFFSPNNTDADKRKSSKMTQKIHDSFGNVFKALDALKACFHYS